MNPKTKIEDSLSEDVDDTAFGWMVLNTIDEENNEYKRQIFQYSFEIHLQIHDFLDFKL
jgi:hypothetical protein